MANDKTSGQKPGPVNKQAADARNISAEQVSSAASATPDSSSSARKSSSKGKTHKSRVGGTAVPGAKSTQPKPASTSSDPNQQQIESYNRDMRRRMEHLGAGPYAQENRTQSLQEQRQKRLDRRKQRLDEKRQEMRKAMPGGKISLGRKNTYFVIAAAALVVLIIVVFAILRLTNVLH
ncbi:MAG TPA: hypothetical protein VKR06_03850 [Ktedonosporobacter sp.]|nr:hypothetical protein [Ktedonosporobacter sp.]